MRGLDYPYVIAKVFDEKGNLIYEAVDHITNYGRYWFEIYNNIIVFEQRVYYGEWLL